MNAKTFKTEIEKSNNSVFTGRKRRNGLNIYCFRASTASAGSVEEAIRHIVKDEYLATQPTGGDDWKRLTKTVAEMNKVVMNKLEDDNYEIFIDKNN